MTILVTEKAVTRRCSVKKVFLEISLEKGTAYFDDFRLKFILIILVLRMPAVWSEYSLNIHKRRSKAIQKKTWSNSPKCC